MTRQRQQQSFMMTKQQSTITHSSAVGGGALLYLPHPLRLGFLLISLALFSSILIGCIKTKFPHRRNMAGRNTTQQRQGDYRAPHYYREILLSREWL